MQKTITKHVYAAALFLGLSLLSFASHAVEFDEAKVQIREIALAVEYAHSFEQRATGLMHRKSLCDNCGMLFKYSRPRIAGMWMKNTFIPLDVAFIDDQGKITDIRGMQPHDLTSINSSTEVLYALEMNLGWFAKHNVNVGDIVEVAIPK
ncbi:DUF192 domain-containing protein [Aliiglaciecola sp. 3_MG-2023]|uniref:DUF192 domain-containing protein n=1 Tax=Aliiglaciecola sp. 3_MG-2023 TaxID=3062644 RepID=UPI0026E196E5|nr:DUF192 domain-containing protein [Aliiglaciecola sp. 3_MG-2023]MDO6695038.1 DUF192 domain-containing protein [Aliiglaciecola sp. 3_MG-2023]